MKATDYITLDVPAPFHPDSPATFRVHFSTNYMGKYATLVVYGYEMKTPTRTYTGGKFTELANVAENREGLLEFVIPGGTLGHDTDSYSLNGMMRAYVVFDSTLDGDGNVNPESSTAAKSNVVYVPMSCLSNSDFTFEYTEADGSYLSTGSRYTIWFHIVFRTSAGLINGNDVNSYRVLLYDNDMNIVSDSGERKDWYANNPNKSYRLKNLKDNTDYYVQAIATTNSGMVLYTPLTPLRVRYNKLPAPSYRVKLSNVVNGIQINVDLTELTYTKIMISRRAYSDDGLLVLKSVDQPNTSYTFTDHFAIPKKTYVYNVVVYNGNAIVGTFSSYLLRESNHVVIADRFGCYAAIGNITKYPISRNNRGAEIEVMD